MASFSSLNIFLEASLLFWFCCEIQHLGTLTVSLDCFFPHMDHALLFLCNLLIFC